MPFERIPKKRAITKTEFHQRLRQWLETNEDRIGPYNIDYGGTGWVYVQNGAELFKLNADTRRLAVEAYLQSVELYGDAIKWTLVESQRGNLTAVAYGPQQIRHRSFYLYAVEVV